MKPQQKTLTLWIVVILLMALVAKFATVDKVNNKFIKYPDFVKAVQEKNVEEVIFKGKDSIMGKFKPGYEAGSRFTLTGNTGDATFNILRENGIIPQYEEEEKQTFFTSLLLNWGPMILLIVIFYFLFFKI